MESSESGEANNQSINHEAGPSNAISSSKKPYFFKLDTDCCEEMFEYLKLCELYALGRTCKTLQYVAGDYFRRNYSAADNKIYSVGGKYGGFHRFMSTISFEDNALAAIYFIKTNLNQFESLNKIKIEGYYSDFQWNYCNSILKMLPNISSLELKGDSRNYMNAVINFGRHLKHLSLSCDIDYFDEYFFYDFFEKNFPNLEYLKLRGIGEPKQIVKFLQRHPTIHTLSTDRDIPYCHNQLHGTKIKLDTLELDLSRMQYDLIVNRILELHAEGFYKRFSIIFWNLRGVALFQYYLDKIGIIPGLEKLTLGYLNFKQIPNLNWSPIVNLKELTLHHIETECIDVLSLATALTNLERVNFETTFITTDKLLPFIRLSQKLKMIKVLFSQPQGAINLQMWNRERQKLAGARKILVYVDDDVFVATKWAASNGAIDLKFIQIKRYESCE